MKFALLCNNKKQFSKVYDENVISGLKAMGECTACMTKKEMMKNKDEVATCDYIFSTWGMPVFSAEEIQEYFPNVKAVFYAAGTVQSFAEPFLNSGIKVFSAFAANGIPVAEYTFAQIILASKGYFQSAKYYRTMLPVSTIVGRQNFGNFEGTVGLVGLGAIGAMVAEKLKSLDVRVFAYDPFVSEERASSLGVELVSITDLFDLSDVISNHLANKKELINFFNADLFKRMKPNASFINTGRGAQVDEGALAKALLAHPKRTAIIDVLKSEITPFFSPLWYCPNAILTPHIAGSTGHEVTRMAYYMLEEASKLIAGEEVRYEVTLEQLKTMA